MSGATAAYEAGWRGGLLAGEGAAAEAISRASLNDNKTALSQTLRTAAVAVIAGQSPNFEGQPIAEYVNRMNAFYDAVATDYAKSKLDALLTARSAAR